MKPKHYTFRICGERITLRLNPLKLAHLHERARVKGFKSLNQFLMGLLLLEEEYDLTAIKYASLPISSKLSEELVKKNQLIGELEGKLAVLEAQVKGRRVKIITPPNQLTYSEMTRGSHY